MAKKNKLKGQAKPQPQPQPRTAFVFLNCQNLDAPQQPIKVKDLAATIRAAAGGQPPGFFGVCEVHDIVSVRALADEVADKTYDLVVSAPKTDAVGATGIALCYDKGLFEVVDTVRDRLRRPRTAKTRSYWLAAQLRFQAGSKASLWVILNHWKSQLRGEMETELTRIENFREIEELFRTTSDLHRLASKPVDPVIRDSDFVLIAGDFNCEPGSRPLAFPTRAQGVEVSRHFGSVAGVTRNRARFLNTMWSLMATDDPARSGFRHGTHDSGGENFGPRMFDQILVSRALVEQGAQVQYVANSTMIQPTLAMASDHAAVAATLEY